jgi:hypothetical protein
MKLRRSSIQTEISVLELHTKLQDCFENGKIDGIKEEFDKQGNIIETTLWKDGKLIEITEPELTPNPNQIIPS